MGARLPAPGAGDAESGSGRVREGGERGGGSQGVTSALCPAGAISRPPVWSHKNSNFVFSLNWSMQIEAN